jgi:hypothetical protein
MGGRVGVGLNSDHNDNSGKKIISFNFGLG